MSYGGGGSPSPVVGEFVFRFGEVHGWRIQRAPHVVWLSLRKSWRHWWCLTVRV